MRLILVTYEHAQCNDNQCLRCSIAVASVACSFKSIRDFLPWSCVICTVLMRQLSFSHWAASHLFVLK
jgi:hypothetical protein